MTTFVWRGLDFQEETGVLLDLYGTNHDPLIWTDPETVRPEPFREWSGNLFRLVPQGGGDHYTDHRCAGEWITVESMKRAVPLLTRGMWYDVSVQHLRIDLARMPAIPRSRW